jgi:hypothetical protein
MEPAVTVPAFSPPALPGGKNGARSSRWSGLALAGVFAAAAIAASILAHDVADGAIPFPECGFKKLTGLACPGCGGTRSLVAIGGGDVPAAFVLNPAVALAWFLFVASVPMAAIDALVTGGRAAARLSRFASTRFAARLLVAAIAANWIFLLVAGR